MKKFAAHIKVELFALIYKEILKIESTKEQQNIENMNEV